MMPLRSLAASSLILLGLAACNDDDNNSSNNTPVPVTVDFKAQINGADFTCGQSYQNVGSPGNAYKVNDYRFYLYNMRLTKAEGSRVKLNLDQDGVWQYQDSALLDFENGCLNGTAPVNTQVRGTLPAGEKLSDYTGICFVIGLPFEQNHADPASAPSPINASGMLWSWTTGRKFIRVDGVGDPEGLKTAFHLHLGSTHCTAGSGTGGAPSAPCGTLNTPEICLSNFKTDSQRLVADAGKVLSAVNVTVNTPNTAGGCMSGNNDPECLTIMPKLGLNFGYEQTPTTAAVTYPAEQQVFIHAEAK